MKIADAPECEIDGLVCLHQKTWPIWTLRDCECPVSCVHFSYIEQTKIFRQWYVCCLQMLYQSYLHVFHTFN